MKCRLCNQRVLNTESASIEGKVMPGFCERCGLGPHPSPSLAHRARVLTLALFSLTFNNRPSLTFSFPFFFQCQTCQTRLALCARALAYFVPCFLFSFMPYISLDTPQLDQYYTFSYLLFPDHFPELSTLTRIHCPLIHSLDH